MSKRVEIGIPEKIRLFDHGDRIEIRRIWLGWDVLFLTAFMIFWDSMTYRTFVTNGDTNGAMTIFGLPFIAVSIFFSYLTLAKWLNRTSIVARPHEVTVRHYPVPWAGNTSIPSADISQLYAKEKINKSSDGDSTAFEVRAILRDGRNVKLVGGLANSEQALFIEQELEKFLGIEDAVVKGEIR